MALGLFSIDLQQVLHLRMQHLSMASRVQH